MNLPEFFLSSQIRHHRRNFFDRRDLETVFLNSRSLAFRKSPVVEHIANMWQTLPGDFHIVSETKEKWSVYWFVISKHDFQIAIQIYKLKKKIKKPYLNGCWSFGITNFLISFFKCVRFEPLPRQRTSQEIHEHMAQCLQIVAARLLSPHMCIYRHVSSGSC